MPPAICAMRAAALCLLCLAGCAVTPVQPEPIRIARGHFGGEARFVGELRFKNGCLVAGAGESWATPLFDPEATLGEDRRSIREGDRPAVRFGQKFGAGAAHLRNNGRGWSIADIEQFFGVIIAAACPKRDVVRLARSDRDRGEFAVKPFSTSTIMLGLLSLAACASPPAGQVAGKAEPIQSAIRAAIEPSGYATILDAPPAPFTATEPTAPPPPTAQQIADQEQFTRVGRFQGSVAGEVQALVDRLRRDERGNFVSVYYDNDGDPSVVFQFLRAGPETLRKYTRHPRFIGKTVRWSMAQLIADQAFVMKTFAADRVIEGLGIGRNDVDVYLLVSEAEFRALAARKGVTLPESVVLNSRSAPVVGTGQPAVAPNPPMAPEIARLVRIFPRDDRPVGTVNAINSRARIVLRDGCFRLADQAGALVLFPLGAQMFVDAHGYLAFGPAAQPGYARVGEIIEFPGSITEVSTPELVDPIHAVCGPGKVIKVTAMASAAARDTQQRATDNFGAVQRLRSEFGLDEAQARRAFDWLERHQAAQPRQRDANGVLAPPITAEMVINSPPSPVMNASACPPGSKLTFGLCRTPEGHLRPLPPWLARISGAGSMTKVLALMAAALTLSSCATVPDAARTCRQQARRQRPGSPARYHRRSGPACRAGLPQAGGSRGAERQSVCLAAVARRGAGPRGTGRARADRDRAARSAGLGCGSPTRTADQGLRSRADQDGG